MVNSIETSHNVDEREQVIQDSRKKEYRLKSEIKKNNTYKRLNFHYDVSDIPRDGSSLIKRLKEKYKNDDSREWALLNNPQIQNMLGNILGEHVREWNKKTHQRSEQETQQQEWEDQNKKEEAETWEDYRERESSPENFEEFLLSDEGIRILLDEIDKHLDDEWNIHKNYPISEKDIKLKLKKSRYSMMQREYNEKNDITTDAETQEIKKMGNIVVDGIDTAVWNYLKSGWNAFDGWMIRELENLLNDDKNAEIINKIKQNPTLKDEFNRALRESIRRYYDYVKIGDSISLNTWNKQIDLQIRSYLFVYWKFFYPWLFKTDQWTPYYERELPKIIGVIIATDKGGNEEFDKAIKDIIKNNEFLEREKKAEEERRQRDTQRRQEAAKRNRERNGSYNTDNNWERKRVPDSDNSNGDINWATWAQIVRDSDVNLSDFKVNSWNMEAYAESWYAKQKAFGIAWKNFKESNKEIEDIVTADDMRKLYNTNTNSIDEQARKEFLETDIMKWRSQEEIDNIYNILSSFPKEYADALKTIASWVQRQEKRLDDETRNHALGSVIDNVRFVFADIVEKWKWDSKFEWFKFDGSEPVKREWNDIIISGTFNGTAIKIRYDLISWGLFMNSFIQHPTTSKISIWNNNKADLQIGQLESFDTILDEHYRAPDISLSRGSQSQNRWTGGNPSNPDSQNQTIDEWSDITPDSWGDTEEVNVKWKFIFPRRGFRHWLHHEQPAPVEPVVTNTPVNSVSQSSSAFKPSTTEISSNNNSEIEAIKWKYREMLFANLDMISDRIVDNTKKQSARNSVVTKFMKTFNIILDGQEENGIDFNDWSNLFDLLQIIENSDPTVLEKFQLFMEKVMKRSGLVWGSNNLLGARQNQNEEKNNKYGSMLKDKATEFTANMERFKGKMNFESDTQLWFAQMIIDNITDDAGKPNRKLDASKMDDFIRHLETDGANS